MRKNFIRSILTLCISTATISAANAQLGHSKEYVEPPGWSVGMNIGLLDLWGDVGTKSPIDHYANTNYWGKPHFMGGVFVRYTAHPAIAMRLGVNYGTLYADDKWNQTKAEKAESVEDDAYQRYMRNLSIRANTWEGSFVFEFNPLRMNVDAAVARRRFQPYLLAGVAYFHFKPTAKYIDKAGNDRGYINLYDLNLEGTGLPPELLEDAPEKYDLWQLAVPLGLGVKWDIGRQLALGIEYMYRMTFTDYLDNVSNKYINPALYSTFLEPDKAALAAEMQDRSFLMDPMTVQTVGSNRGNPAVKDGYSTFGVTLIFKIKNRKSPWWF
ncbi:MAG: hypothetical protein EOP49_03115 [Sphingobacteriales bacterium]|nr:MAG: hypothetical protein EOP49_03115 [Sphingobacteriales bacterium]